MTLRGLPHLIFAVEAVIWRLDLLPAMKGWVYPPQSAARGDQDLSRFSANMLKEHKPFVSLF